MVNASWNIGLYMGVQSYTIFVFGWFEIIGHGGGKNYVTKDYKGLLVLYF